MASIVSLPNTAPTSETEASKTPILDLEVPLPEKCGAGGIKEGTILVLIAAAAIAYVGILGWGAFTHNHILVSVQNWQREVFGSYSALFVSILPLLFVVSLVPIMISIVTIHEAGHVLAGWLVGFRFEAVTIGPISIVGGPGRPALKLGRLETLNGTAHMEIDAVKRLRSRLTIFIAGGPLATMISCLAVEFILQSRIGAAWPPLLWGIAQLFVVWSLLVLVVNLFPFLRKNGQFTDGARLTHLYFSLPKARRWLSIQALGLQHRTGVNLHECKKTWIRAATSLTDCSRDALVGFLYAYLQSCAQKDAIAAAAHLERCLERIPLLHKHLSCVLIQEASVFHAWFRRDSRKAKEWLNKLETPEALPALSQIRIDVAIRCAEAKFREAQKFMEKGFDEIAKLPATPANRQIGKSWKSWLQEIESEEAKMAEGAPATGTGADGA